MILVGDIGGTNTTLAVVRHEDGRFTIVDSRRYSSAGLSGLEVALSDFLESRPWHNFSRCCLSGAGPVHNNVCTMTNVAWTIDGNQISTATGLPTFVINDFTAICYALPLIDTHPEIQTLAIPHTDGSTPSPQGRVRAVVGAGTGLGTGYLIEDGGRYTAFPSEAGHAAFAPFDDDTLLLQGWLDRKYSERVGAEQYVSGQGIRNIYLCMREAGRIGADSVTAGIDEAPLARIPEMVATHAPGHEGLASVMRLFVRMYGHYASNTALCLLPAGGLYIAGGIGAKNHSWLLDDNLFMSTFERNYNERITPLLKQTPVILIKDYSVSLYGAAHAAISFA